MAGERTTVWALNHLVSPHLNACQDGLLLVPLGALGETLVSATGVGYALAATVLYTLKDAALRGRLGASTFKALNIGKPCCRYERGSFA